MWYNSSSVSQVLKPNPEILAGKFDSDIKDAKVTGKKLGE
jgi:hypothetical protein